MPLSPPAAPAATAKSVLDLPGTGGPVAALAFTPDRALLVAADSAGAARVWAVSSSKPGPRCVMHTRGDPAAAVAAGPTGRVVALGSGTVAGTVRVFDITDPTPAEGVPLRGGRGAVRAVAYSADGKLVAAGGEDAAVRVWEPGPAFRGDARAILPGHTKPVRAVAFAPDGQSLVTGSEDGTARVWAVSRIRSSQRAVLPHPAAVDAVAYLSGGTVATACRDGRVRVWDVAGTPAVRAEAAVHPACGRVLVAAGGDLLVGTADGSVVANWNARTGRLVEVWDVPGGPGTAAALTGDGRYLARGTAAGAIGVYRVAAKRG